MAFLRDEEDECYRSSDEQNSGQSVQIRRWGATLLGISLLACAVVAWTTATDAEGHSGRRLVSPSTSPTNGTNDTAGEFPDEKEVKQAINDEVFFQNEHHLGPRNLTAMKLLGAENVFMEEYLQEWHANNNDHGKDPPRAAGGFLRAAKHGQVKSLYTIGAPGSGSPGLKSNIGACFPGVRVFSKEKCQQVGSTEGCFFDPVTWVANSAWLWHPRMAAAGVSLSPSQEKNEYHACADTKMRFPPYGGRKKVNTDLHLTEKTYNRAVSLSKLPILEPHRSSSQQLADISYEQHDLNHAQALAQQIGHNVVGAAKFEGSWSEGLQVSYLLQAPTSLDCILTFQGTYSKQDIWTDLAAKAVSFCGLTKRGENCCNYSPWCTGDCAPKGPNDSFVHQGFRNQLRRITGEPSFQKNIHSKLSSCRNVDVFGHSMGGAMAELFTACAERYKEAGEYGYEDYAKIGWTKGTPAALPIYLSFT